MIELERVTVTFGATVALDDVSVSLPAGVTGLFGPNGSGKSTMLRTLAGRVRPGTGTVTHAGRPMSFGDESLRRTIGWMGHETGLYGTLTLRENLTMFARLYDSPLDRVDGVIAEVGLEDRAGVPVETLSAGLARRAALARAVVHDPSLLFLDEPYANLDDDAAALVSQCVVSWRERHPSGVCVVATHGAKKVKPYADARIVLQRGRVVSP